MTATTPTSASTPAAPPAPASRPRWDHAVPGQVRFFLLMVWVLLALFALLRLGLILRTRTPGDATNAELAGAFLTGLRFDLSAACLAMAPVMVLCYLPWTSPARGPRTRRAFLWGLTVVVFVAVLTLLAEFEFFREFQSRFNQLAIRYLDQPATVAGMAWYNYPVVPYVLACLAVVAVVNLVLRVVLRWAFPRGGASAAPPRRARWGAEIGGAVAVVGCIVVGARGGLQSEPLRWGDAFHGDNEYASQMSLNGLWTLGMAVADTMDRGRQAGGWLKQMPADEARKTARELVVGPGEELLDPARRTVYRRGLSPGALVLNKTRTGRPPNVVVVMMESFSARFCGATGAPRSFTPGFDALAKDGMLFDRAMSAGSHTHQGIFATQLGFPNVPGYETLMQSGIANQEFSSLASVLQGRGYKTFFLYNGNFAWDNMRGFFRKQGVETFIGGDEMKAEAQYLDAVWGVSDGDLFNRCNREFEAAHKSGKPFYAAVMTLSNHAPFQVPPVPGTAPITDMGEQNKRLEAMRYADYAVAKFVEDARKLSYFEDTLFVFVGDHGFAVKPTLTDVNLLYHHVPLLVLAPGLGGPKGVDHRVAGQTDVVPTVLGLAGMTDAAHSAWGRNLFDGRPPEQAFSIFKMSGGGRAVAMAQGDHLLVLRDAKADPTLLTFTLWPPAVTPATGPDVDAKRKAMSKELKAYVQAAVTDLTGHQAGPPAAK